jgi:hypothetical protein
MRTFGVYWWTVTFYPRTSLNTHYFTEFPPEYGDILKFSFFVMLVLAIVVLGFCLRWQNPMRILFNCYLSMGRRSITVSTPIVRGH